MSQHRAALQVLGPAALAIALGSVFPAVALPPGFNVTNVASGWNQAVGLTFAPGGRMFVWEKAGLVWTVEDGVKSDQPLINIHDEVGDWRDFGLLGFCLDPDFDTNGYIYLMYVVDYEHLKYYGTPDYDPNADWYYRDTIARITRYTANAADGFHSVDYDSRKVLLGETISTGFPICHQSHGIGTLRFGEDGSLLAGCGDGASYEEVDNGGPRSGSSNTALEDGIIRKKEDIGAFRAQLVDCLSGKIVRLDPQTGDGVANNPFYDPADARAPRSRVWEMGLRNPFRWTIRPGTGDAGNPGTLYIGDVGWYTWEEMDIARAPGVNFGWPIFEGMEVFGPYYDASPFNLDAPNPLAGQNGCDDFFRFRDLLVQETQHAPSWPNPCNPDEQVPPDIHTFMDSRPSIDWGHGGPSRVKTWTDGNPTWANLGDPDGIPGPQFAGNCAVGGTWYSGDDFPPEYKNTYFQADYGGQWIRNIVLDDQDNPVSVSNFAGEGEPGYIVCITDGPQGLYLIRYDGNANIAVQKISYGNGQGPVVIASAAPSYGPAPLTVQLKGSDSYDPEGGKLSYLWDFGDGMRSMAPDPVHTYGQNEDITAQGTFIGKIFSLDPPHPIGGGNWDPEVMRDGDFPPLYNNDSSRQYDTYHGGDQGSSDWIGYSFAQPRELRALLFQEGIQFFDGGWFDNLRVQVRINNNWTEVAHLIASPAYAGWNQVNYETFGLSFDPVTSNAIRISGNPGGSANFISIGELRVIAKAAQPVQDPTRVDVKLTATDDAGNSASASLIVSLNNTPPQVNITSPVDGSLYALNQDTIVDMIADISDAEQGPDQLSCTWQQILHHNEHTHPEPPVHDCATQSVVNPYGCGGETYYYEFRLTVADDAGLEATQSVFMYPDCSCPADCNADGIADLFDFLCFTNAFNHQEPAADCDHSTGEGVFDLFDFLCFQNRFAAGC